jgi:hypothetical protein
MKRFAATIVGAFFFLAPTGAVAQGEPVKPDPFWSTSTQSAFFMLGKKVTRKGEVKEFRGGASPFTRENNFDARMVGNPRYGQPMREVSNWFFTAVRTKDRTGKDVSTVIITGTANNLWNIVNPLKGGIISRSGFEVEFHAGLQTVHTMATGPSFSGNTNLCAQPPDTMTIPKFAIPNDVFEVMDSIVIRGRSEGYFACR